MKKGIVFFLILILFITLIKFINTPQPPSNRQSIKIGSQNLSVEVADSTAEITLGLGQRDTLGGDGMLFVMSNRSVPTFWMKDMRFDLDFIWIDGDIIIDLTENVSAQRGEPDSALRIYSPKSPVTHVLELNSGAVQKLGIRTGDKVSL